MRTFFAPEVVQTSNMDCGPASLKCLLEGFGLHASYGRLREACQTGVDGTSIDTMEAVATQLGLEAEQIMLPADHLLLASSKALPAIVVVKLPNGLTHFVVLWRVHGRMVQVMDPAIGRRWTNAAQFLTEIYSHSMPVPAAGWREFAGSDDFQATLATRLRHLGISKQETARLLEHALADPGWRSLAALDAATRLANAVRRAGALRNSRSPSELIHRLTANPDLLPARYWSVAEAGDTDGEEQVLMQGAVLVRILGKRASVSHESLGPELRAAIAEPPLAPGRELLRLLKQSGTAIPALLVTALAAGAGAVVIEALLFRGIFDIAGELHLRGQRLGAMAAVLLFSLAVLLLEAPALSGAVRLGRQIENRLRMAFLIKIPKLGDRYFQSRLTSDMAERSHSTHRLRYLPDLIRQLLRSIFELLATAAGIVWLDPPSAPFVIAALIAALLPAFGIQSVLAERDLRVRSHAAGLTRFYLDAMLGLISIRAHSAEQSMRREHEKLLGEWAHAAFRLQKTVLGVESVQMLTMFGLVAALLLFHPLRGAEIGGVLLIVYWALNLPSLGQRIATVSRQYPYYRSLALRLLDPLGAPEEPSPAEPRIRELAAPPSIEFRNVAAEASGHRILQNVNLRIEPGTEVAIVGPSGAGKSSLVGLLLSWLKPVEGEILIDDAPLDRDALRKSVAWVDPAVQLWNRTLFSNLSYGAQPDAREIAQVIDTALLRSTLESLPNGFETRLGEGGGLVSGGEGQRVRLARAMLRKNTRLVILDEPFRGLDREKRRELLTRARLFWRPCTLLCVTHDLSETRSFDRVLVVEHGRIVEDGSPERLCTQSQSRYAQLLAAEERTRSGLWNAGLWRRIRIHSGRIVEEHKPAEDKRRESEVA